MLIEPVMILSRLMMADCRLLRRRLHFLQHAVDPEADAKSFLQRLEMNVARAEHVRLEQEHRDHADDRRVCFIDWARFRPIANFQTKIDRRQVPFAGRPPLHRRCRNI